MLSFSFQHYSVTEPPDSFISGGRLGDMGEGDRGLPPRVILKGVTQPLNRTSFLGQVPMHRPVPQDFPDQLRWVSGLLQCFVRPADR